jgi:hypothetical protein
MNEMQRQMILSNIDKIDFTNQHDPSLKIVANHHINEEKIEMWWLSKKYNECLDFPGRWEYRFKNDGERALNKEILIELLQN